MKFSKILVPLKGGLIDAQAVQLACLTARYSHGRVVMIHVIQVSRAQPLEVEDSAEIQHGEEILEQAEKLAQDLGIHPETELLQARSVGPVILEEANRRGIDLIVMGVPYHSPLEEFQLGTAVRYVLKNALCQVWLCREAASQSGTEKTQPKGHEIV
jgi:nucleotide-binding universal stress UspA family protein